MLPSSSLEHALYCFDANSPHLAISASCFFSCPLFNGMHFSEGVPTGLQSDEIFSVTMLNMNQNINPDTYVCLQFVEHPVLFGRFRHAHLGGKNVTSWHVQPETIQLWCIDHVAKEFSWSLELEPCSSIQAKVSDFPFIAFCSSMVWWWPLLAHLKMAWHTRLIDRKVPLSFPPWRACVACHNIMFRRYTGT